MFLNKFFHFLKGYVILYLTGFNIERFLSVCAQRKICLWDIKERTKESLYISVSLSDFFKLRTIAYKTKTRVHIKKKAGLPIILKKYKKRYFLFSGLFVFIIIFSLMTQFIWSVEIEGVENADIVEITKILKSSGIYEGAYKGSALSSGEIKNILLNKVDNISWAWVYLKGTKAVCKIYESSIPIRNLSEGEPADVIAARDGIISKIIAKEGVTVSAIGNTVMAGDILVSGILPNDLGEIGGRVSASAIVEAHTWHEKTDTYKLYREYKEPTGNVKKYYSLKLFSKTLPLFLDDTIPFKDYIKTEDKYELKLFGDMYLGISLECETVTEVSVIKEEMSYDMAVYEGKCDLEKRIARELLPGAELKNQNLYHCLVDEETAEVTLTMEFIENIGIKAPIREFYEREKQE